MHSPISQILQVKMLHNLWLLETCFSGMQHQKYSKGLRCPLDKLLSSKQNLFISFHLLNVATTSSKKIETPLKPTMGQLSTIDSATKRLYLFK